jgi:hypothetical protein
MTPGRKGVGKISAASGSQRYLEMRHRLVAYFDRKNCISPADLADETLNHVARRLEEEGVTYCVVLKCKLKNTS